MKIVPTEAFGEPNQQGLESFLNHCKSEALSRGHPILSSITLPSEYLDPLAVLQTVNDRTKRHFYVERRSRKEAIAVAEPILIETLSGEDRFEKAKAFVKEWESYTICAGESDLFSFGPLFITHLTFDSNDPDKKSAIFVPRWQVLRQGNEFSATANVLVDEKTPVDFMSQKIWRAHSRFRAFEFESEDSIESVETFRQPRKKLTFSSKKLQSDPEYLENVSAVLDSIKSGELKKAVISRKIDIDLPVDFRPLSALESLRRTYPDCYAFSYQYDGEKSLVGASPERLVSVSKGLFKTESLAGTIKRGDSAQQDAHLTKKLLSSEKDQSENQIVLDFIVESLKALGLEASYSERPEVVQLHNVQHLKIPLLGSLNEGVNILDLVETLHPTPALGGYPKEKAIDLIRSLEMFDRNAFSGVTGWFDMKGDGKIFVNIRCAEVSTANATLYAGAGIVEDSRPETELEETTLKLRAMLGSLEVEEI